MITFKVTKGDNVVAQKMIKKGVSRTKACPLALRLQKVLNNKNIRVGLTVYDKSNDKIIAFLTEDLEKYIEDFDDGKEMTARQFTLEII
jgi:hypothetical protein